MYSKVLLVVATIAVAAAQHNEYSHGHGHGHAVSSQNVVLHQTHGHVEHAPVIAHHAPVIAHHAPVITHHAPVVAHHVPVIAHAPVVHHESAHHASHGHEVDYHAPAHYSFEYSVNDPHTKDIKSQKETREGDKVQGSYSLHEADGTIRRVEYTADKHSGFNAVVHREGHAAHAIPVHQSNHHSYH